MNKNKESVKKLGQVFTPPLLVKFMLDVVDYSGEKILKKHILDNSCGNGNFLVEIVKRYLEVSKLNKASLKTDLESYIHGVEVDPILHQECLSRLNSIFPANYDIKLGDALFISDYNGKMDFVVGNPPYVKVHNLNVLTKDVAKAHGLAGMINLSTLFYLLSFEQLNSNGQIIYLTPTFFQAKQTQNLRKRISEEKKLIQVFDFKHQQIFPDVDTYSVIAHFKNNRSSADFIYSAVELGSELKIMNEQRVEWNEVLVMDKMFFGDLELNKALNQELKKPNIVQVKNGFSTLADKVFIQKNFPFQTINQIKIFKSSTGEIKQCLFPYYYSDEKQKWLLKKFTELEPELQEYFLFHKDRLLARDISDKEKEDEWYAFGRRQAFADLNSPRIYFNSLFNNEVDNVLCGIVQKKEGVYGGIYLIINDSLAIENVHQTIIKETKTNEFKAFVRSYGESKGGGWYKISPQVLEKYLELLLSRTLNKEYEC